MTTHEFEHLPGLVFPHEAERACGYSRGVIYKMIECGVLRLVRPKGAGQGKLMTVQLARLVEDDIRLLWGPVLEREPMLLSAKTVLAWTGYDKGTLRKIVLAGGLRKICVAGGAQPRYRKREVAELMGMGAWV